MKIPASWLNEYLETQMSAKRMAEALELSGVEIEQIISSNKLDKNIVVGLVNKVIQHPNADKLKLAEIDSGRGVVSLVCGAPNLLVGQKVALAQVGSVLPNGVIIKAAVIRGEKSEGMLCSPLELGIGDDHSGIMVLDDELSIGTKLCDVWNNDDILDVKTQANRADLQSVVGLAREIAAITKTQLNVPTEKPWPGGGAEIQAVNQAKDKVSRYMVGDIVVNLETSIPNWMKQRLEGAGVRPINIIVDVTNYVMLELGQPLHAFDAIKVKLPITVRLAKKGEKIVTLDNITRSLTNDDLVIADKEGPIALAGVMGGKRTSVTTSTRRIILESATFDGPTIRKTAQRHGLRSEASGRFERRLPVQLAPLALNRVAELLIKHAGAKSSGGTTDLLEVWPWVQHIGARSSRLSELFGTELSGKKIVGSLQRLGFEAEVFDIAAEARKHLGKPYVWGAKFKVNGTAAFDCSYLVDYVYSLIGLRVGHTALGQFELGRPVHTGELRPGDVVFYEGKIDKSVTDHFYTLDDNKTHIKHELSKEKRVGHNGIYVGNDRVVMAAKYGFEEGFWTPLKRAEVVEVPLKIFTENPSYLGARRYAENLDEYVAITVPWWRPDVKTEEDILEEVARMIGYDSLPATLPPWQPKQIKADKRWPKIWQIKSVLQSLGLFEVFTYSFISGEQLDEYGYDKAKHLKLKNPLSVEQEYLRSDLLPSMVGAVGKNSRYKSEFGMFEVSKVFKFQGSDKLPDEPTYLAVIVRQKNDGYRAVKMALDLLTHTLGVDFSVKAEQYDSFLTGRSAEVRVGTKIAGRIGEIHPDRLKKAKISGSLGYLELDIDFVLANLQSKRYQLLSKYPGITRDLALVVKDDVTWDEVRAAINKTKQARPEFLSDYYGADLTHGHKSMAVRLHISSMERTMLDQEADKIADEVLKALGRAVGAKLR